MLFSTTLNPLDIADIYMNYIKIDYASSTWFLGVIIDDKLKFNLHINEITKKISKNTGVLYRLRQYVPNKTLLAVYRSIIESHISYCNLIFGNACVTHLSPLEIAQKKAVRIVANEPPLSHSNQIFINLNLLKLHDHYNYNLGIYMRKNIEIFAQNFRINLNNTLSGNHYEPSFQRIDMTLNKSIMFQAPKNWEKIPIPIRNSRSLNSFKRGYKTFLLSFYHRVDQ